MRLIPILTLALIAATAVVAPAWAGTYNFSYSGVGNAGSGQGTVGSGTGSFTTADSTVVTMSDVTAFNFTLNVTYQPAFTNTPNPVTDTFNFMFLDLLTFSANVTGGTLSSLALTTKELRAQFEFNQGLSFNSAGVSTTGNADGGPTTSGTLTLGGQSTNVPEPAPIALLVVGMAGLIQARRRAVR